jgi:hypothetical protein
MRRWSWSGTADGEVLEMVAGIVADEAYHSALVTAEESRAHLDALRRLAGPPALTQPWTDQESARVWSWPLGG